MIRRRGAARKALSTAVDAVERVNMVARNEEVNRFVAAIRAYLSGAVPSLDVAFGLAQARKGWQVKAKRGRKPVTESDSGIKRGRIVRERNQAGDSYDDIGADLSVSGSALAKSDAKFGKHLAGYRTKAEIAAMADKISATDLIPGKSKRSRRKNSKS